MQHNGFFKTGKHIQCSSNLSVWGHLMALAGGLENLPWATYQVLLGNSCVLSHWYHYCALCVTWRKVEWVSRTFFPKSTWELQVAVGGRKEGCALGPFLPTFPVVFCLLRLSRQEVTVRDCWWGAWSECWAASPRELSALGSLRGRSGEGQGNSSWWFRGAAEKSQVTCLGLLFSD